MNVLPGVLAADLAIVFCGTAAGTASARRRAYYAGPGNAFWPTLHAVGLTPRQLRPEEYPVVLQYGLGLTDLAKSVSGADQVLRNGHFDRARLRAMILRYQPAILAFTGKRSAHEFLGRPVKYGLQPEKIGGTLLFVLPSPSGAARRFWSRQPWQELAQYRQSNNMNQ